jgi:hypothetical protein
LRTSTPELGFARGSLIPIGAADRLGGLRREPKLLAPQPLLADFFSLARLLYEDTSNSAYHSLQAQLRVRSGNSLLGFAFTWSHSVDDASDFFDTAGVFALPQDSLRRSERGDSAFDARLRAVTHFVWTVPLKRPGLSDWQISGIATAQTGMPFTVNSSFDVNRDGNLTDRLQSASGLDFSRPDRRTRLRLASTDPLALLAPRGASGAMGRNTFRAPGINNIDLALSRTFRLSETRGLTVRVEAFNVLNRAAFGVPVRILEAPAFGSPVTTVTPGRTLQFGLKLRL